MTLRLYRDDPYLLDFDAQVVERRERDGKPAVVLDRTAFYAESGGQPWDLGTLGGVAVEAVVEDGDTVLHVLSAPLSAGQVRGLVDGVRRRDHRQQHHGQHLLSRALLDLFGAQTRSFHLGADAVSIDLDLLLSEDQLRAAEERANAVVWGAHPIRVRTVTRAEAQALGVVAPPDAGDAIRLVEAEGFDLQPCGGTHPRSTAEVGVIVILGQERYKGGSRVRFVCGHRALTAFGDRRAVLDRLGAVFSTSWGELPEAATRLVERLSETTRRSRELMDQVLEGEARRLYAEAAAATPAGSVLVVVAVFEGWSPEDLRSLAQKVVTVGPCVALLAARAEKVHLVFAQSEGLGRDIPGLLRDAASLLGGRGGGRGNLAQGGGEQIERLDEALSAAAQTARRTPTAGSA